MSPLYRAGRGGRAYAARDPNKGVRATRRIEGWAYSRIVSPLTKPALSDGLG
jgi:hypothetical protein